MTSGLHIFFAANLPPLDGSAQVFSPGRSIKDVKTLLGAVGLVVVLVVIWAVFIRKRKNPLARRRLEHRHRHRHHEAKANQDGSSDSGGILRFGRRRRRRREHRQRNPTLAETGGLPPLRTERPPEQFP